jgi:hypothetical protein
MPLAAKKRRCNVEGCQQVTVPGQAVRATGLESVLLVPVSKPHPAETALCRWGAAKKKPRRIKGEMARDKLFVESKGSKAILRAYSGNKLELGGLEWKDTEMAGAVANWALLSLSFKAAGKTIYTGLRTGARIFFKPEPLRNYDSRRRMGAKNAVPEIPLVDISESSIRNGVFAMVPAKNHSLHDKLLKADAVAMCSDYGTVGDKMFQATHLLTFEFQEGGVDVAGTIWLIVIATSMVMDAWPMGDKKLWVATYTDEEAGVLRCLPVEAARALAAQLIYARIYWIIIACRCLSLTFDGGG